MAKEKDLKTEEKILNAARIVFLKKGYVATRTRDIADEAAINLALLNYYFRSKEKLFEIIMNETMTDFFKTISSIFNNTTTSLEEKIELMVEHYIDLLISKPNVPLFILTELRTNPKGILAKFNMKQIIMNSSFHSQLNAKIMERKSTLNPIQFLMSLMSLIMFPFIANPIFKQLGNFSNDHFNMIMNERKKLIPIWMNAILIQ